jgi:hypothetical protein
VCPCGNMPVGNEVNGDARATYCVKKYLPSRLDGLPF